jgi:protocatechuate 3,4-dioxygenase beta subunit
MDNHLRRDFLRLGSGGLAAMGFGSLLLAADAPPTEPSGSLGAYGRYVREKQPTAAPRPAGVWQPTEDNILGPFYRPAAPYRAKITPPLEPGDPLLIRGRVWGHDTRRPLVHATLDIWQANAEGRYDNDDPQKPPKEGVFLNRARLITDENGYYEFETIQPGRYQIDTNVWRPSHVHYMVQHPGYKTLVTQLYFKGDPYNKTDQFIKQSLIIDVEEVKLPQGIYHSGMFDIVLAKA